MFSQSSDFVVMAKSFATPSKEQFNSYKESTPIKILPRNTSKANESGFVSELEKRIYNYIVDDFNHQTSENLKVIAVLAEIQEKTSDLGNTWDISYDYYWVDRRTGRRAPDPESLLTLTPEYVENVVLVKDSGYNTAIVWSFPYNIFRSYLPIDPQWDALYNPLNFYIGSDEPDIITANSEHSNVLVGFEGNDTLQGGNMLDILLGDFGEDTMVGNGGSDRFVLPNPTDNKIITDFNPQEDILVVTLPDFRGLKSGAFIASTQFYSGATATNLDHRFIYNKVEGTLYFDIDGSSLEAQTKIATLPPGLALDHRNIYATDNLDQLITLKIGSTQETEDKDVLTEIDSTQGTEDKDYLMGTPGKDILVGLGGNDILVGKAGDDIIEGDGGDDIVRGGSGKDRIWSGSGRDMIWGNQGRDYFALERGDGFDTIKDFSDKLDKLGLTPGQKFKQLSITQRGRNVAISINNDLLAMLIGVRANQITVADFTQIAANPFY